MAPVGAITPRRRHAPLRGNTFVLVAARSTKIQVGWGNWGSAGSPSTRLDDDHRAPGRRGKRKRSRSRSRSRRKKRKRKRMIESVQKNGNRNTRRRRRKQ